MEEKEMDNTQLNFNQYNNLLKEQQPEMMPSSQPEAIIEKTITEPKKESTSITSYYYNFFDMFIFDFYLSI